MRRINLKDRYLNIYIYIYMLNIEYYIVIIEFVSIY
jgi:hypothetical protein